MSGFLEFLQLRFVMDGVRQQVLLDVHQSHALTLAAFLLMLATGFAALYLLRACRLDLAPRLLLAAVCLGGGVWATHCLALLGMEIPLPVDYQLDRLLNALIFAIAGSLLALIPLETGADRDGAADAMHHQPSLTRVIASGALLGVTMIGAYYLVFASIRFDGSRIYAADLWLYGLVIAVGASLASTAILGLLSEPDSSRSTAVTHLLAATMLGFAASGLNFTSVSAQLLFVETAPLPMLEVELDMAVMELVLAGLLLTSGLSFVLGSLLKRRHHGSTIVLARGGTLYRLEHLLESVPDSMLVVSRSGAVQVMNRSAQELFAVDAATLLSLNAKTLIPDASQFLVDGDRKRNPQRYLEARGQTADGREVPLELSVSELQGSGGDLFVLVARDVSVRKRVEEHIRSLLEENRRLATTDTLTGLPNRRHILDTIGKEISRCMRHGHALSVLMIDIDHFKRINDTHGHAAGDQALKEMADVVRNVARSSDLVSRFGGEEFLLVLTETSLVQAKLVAERLREQVGHTPVITEVGERLQMTISVGVAEWEPGTLFEDIVARADKALYQAKSSGRNQVIVYSEELAMLNNPQSTA